MTDPDALRHDASFASLKSYIVASTGLAYYEGREADLATRIGKRLEATGLPDYAAYLQRLHEGESELEALVADLTIGETYFFRYTEQFDALRDVVLPSLIERNRATRTLRAWSAGCATGPEPYSLSILLRRDLAARVAGWDIQIIGTDINRDFLARARVGEYPEWSFRGVPDQIKQACFEPRGPLHTIAPEYREGVYFQYHNLVRHPFPSVADGLCAFDLILCRNVFIYFDPATMRRLVGQLAHCLVDGGWLVMGHAEANLDMLGAFRVVPVPGATLFQKLPVPPGASVGPIFADVASPLRSLEPGGWAADCVGPSRANGTIGTQSAWTASAKGDLGTTEPVFSGEPRRGVGKLEGAVGNFDARTAAPAGLKGPSRRADAAGARGAATAGGDHEKSAEGADAVLQLMDRGAWEEAEVCCHRLLAATRLDPLLHFFHALLQEHRGHVDAARKSLQQALYLDRNFVLAHYHLGLMLERTQDPVGSARCFKNVLRILEDMAPETLFPHADGLTAANLQELTLMHLELSKRP